MALAAAVLTLLIWARFGPIAVPVAVYVVACAIWPFASRGRCHGDGKHRSPSGRAWRRCKKCKGTGQRLRVGRHVLNAITRTYEKGNR